MRERTQNILESSIRYFIETGNIITSERLFEEFDFGIKPAMIRCELSELDDSGYLSQDRPSGGRRLTRKAYKFLVDGALLRNGEISSGDERIFRSLASLFEKEKKEFIENAADVFKIISAGYGFGGEFYSTGLSDLLARLETRSREDILQVVEDFEFLARRIENARHWWEEELSWPQVFIGKSPVTKSKNISVIAERFDCKGENFFFLMVGPTRMDYEKSLGFFKTLEKIF